MTIPNLIERIGCAIAAQEGWFDHLSRPDQNNNPGDLRGAPWISKPAMRDGYWWATSVPMGQAGMLHLIALRIAEGNSLTQLIETWAPASDGNNPSVYTKNVMTWVGIPDASVPLWSYLEPLVDPRLTA